MKLGNLNLITLKNGAYEAVLAPEVGGAMISLTKNGVEAMNVPTNEEILRTKSTRFGYPLLFPPNRIDGGKFTAAGKTYQFPLNEPARGNSLHGFLHTRAWEVESVSENEAVLVFKGTPDTDFYQYLSCEFEVRRVFELTEEGLKETIVIKNTGKDTMPIGLGFHTAFKADPTSKVRVSIGKRIEVTERMLPTGVVRALSEEEAAFRNEGQNPIAWNMDDHYTVEPIEVIGEKFHGAVIERADATVTYEVDPFYRHWMIWNSGQDGTFICIEPQNWRINAPNLVEELGAEAGMDLLESGKTLEVATFLKIETK